MPKKYPYTETAKSAATMLRMIFFFFFICDYTSQTSHWDFRTAPLLALVASEA